MAMAMAMATVARISRHYYLPVLVSLKPHHGLLPFRRRHFSRTVRSFTSTSRRPFTIAASTSPRLGNHAEVSDERYDVIVVGGGHAGCEAALASARLGAKTLLLTLNIDRIAWQPCNPAVGGPAKSQLVHEVDALGGEIGKVADRCYLQKRVLNVSRGPAVRALRAQTDKREYAMHMRHIVESTPNLSIREAMVTDILLGKNDNVEGVCTFFGMNFYAPSVILTTGTFMSGKIWVGRTSMPAGRAGESASHGLTENLQRLGFETDRLKTGTPARVDCRTVNFSGLEPQRGDNEVSWFSFDPDYHVEREQMCCYLTRTTKNTHQIIKENLHETPTYGGWVEAKGPRYCPSIEDKIVRFQDKESARIREAKTEAFTVKDHRGELYKKHYPPALNDEVWRLEKIAKDGSFHKRLNNAGIFTVEEFLRLVVRDSPKLRNILGNGMSNKMWDSLIEHSKTCVLSGKLYVYYSDTTRNVGVVFNHIYELSGLIAGEQYISADSLSDGQKVFVDTSLKKAYDDWDQVVEYDGKSLLNLKETKSSSTSRNERTLDLVDYANALDNPLSQACLPVPVPSLLSSSIDSSTLIGGSQLVTSNSRAQFDSSLFAPQDHQQITISQQIHSDRYDNGVGLALGPPQSSTSFPSISSTVQQSHLNPFDDWSNNRDKVGEDFLSEDEIRIRSHEMLENEDMQHLLRFFSMGGHASVNEPEDGYSFQSYMPMSPPNFSFDEGRGRPGKAVAGWLKIKAAMRWGFFIRKKAAERRAQIVELDNEEDFL